MRKDFKWVIYGQLGSFMWHKKQDPKRIADPGGRYISDRTTLYTENVLLRLKKARECGANTVVIDIGEAFQYPSHPEIWIDGCLSADRARDFVAKVKAMGYEVIPSLNFSTDHHHWLGPYQRMVSTPDYYRVCEDVIRDTWEICGHPAVFNVGYDEEDMDCSFIHARNVSCLVGVRQGSLYWHDLGWFCDVCRRLGSRPSFWLDKQRRSCYKHEDFVANIGKDTLICPWDYTPVYEGNKSPVLKKTLDGIIRLANEGYDMILNSSNWIMPSKRTPERKTTRENIPNLFAWGKAHLPPERFVGFCVSPWPSSGGTSVAGNEEWFEAAELLRQVRDGEMKVAKGE